MGATLVGDWVIPPLGQLDTFTVDNASWMKQGMSLILYDNTVNLKLSQFFIDSISGTSVNVYNLGTPGNPAAGTTIKSGSLIWLAGNPARPISRVTSACTVTNTSVASNPNQVSVDNTVWMEPGMRIDIEGFGTVTISTYYFRKDNLGFAWSLPSGSVTIPAGAVIKPAIESQIWNVRMRSFNAVGNPHFTVDQRNIGATLTNPASLTWAMDRWKYAKGVGNTFAVTLAKTAGPVLIPGTNFNVSSSFLRVTLTTQQATMAASDYLTLCQVVEGPNFRPLQSDVHSIGALVRSSVAPLTIGFALYDWMGTYSLTVSATISVANQWTLVKMPNLPFWAGSNFSSAVGNPGYYISLALASGSTYITAPNVWTSGIFYAPTGISNFAAQAVNSTFDIAFVQHEPGPVCSGLINKSFLDNYDECLRYFQKTYDYDVAVGAASYVGANVLMPQGAALSLGPSRFVKPMAKIPIMTSYNPGVANSPNTCVGSVSGTSYPVTGFSNVGKSGFYGLNTTGVSGETWH